MAGSRTKARPARDGPVGGKRSQENEFATGRKAAESCGAAGYRRRRRLQAKRAPKRSTTCAINPSSASAPYLGPRVTCMSECTDLHLFSSIDEEGSRGCHPRPSFVRTLEAKRARDQALPIPAVRPGASIFGAASSWQHAIRCVRVGIAPDSRRGIYGGFSE